MSGSDGFGPRSDDYFNFLNRVERGRFAEALRVIADAGADACVIKRKGKYVGISTFARQVLEWSALLETEKQGREEP